MRGEESDHIWFAPGTYYIGDPCYVIPNDEWMEYLDTYPKYPPPDPGYGWIDGIAVNYKGHKCFHSMTAHGDGSYRDNEGHRYGVDAGIIGIIPLALCDKEQLAELEDLGRVVTFDKRFEVYCEKDCTFHFGHISIVTDGSDEEDEEEDEEQAYCSNCYAEVDYEGDLCDDCRSEEDDEEDEE